MSEGSGHRLIKAALLVALGGLLGCTGPDEDPPIDTDSGDTDSDDTDTDTGELLSTVPSSIAGQIRVCESPELRAGGPFEEISFKATNPDWSYLSGYGVAVIDIDASGGLDIVLPAENAVYLNDGNGGFQLVEDRLPETANLAFCSAVTGADYDGDGDFDLFVSLYEYGNRLWRNDGTGHFEDVTEGSGITQDERDTQGSSWADFDGDGDLDLFVANHGFVEPPPITEYGPADMNELYENNGDGTFTDVSERLDESVNVGYTFQGLWYDFDQDGALDLYLVNDFGQVISNGVLLNEEGHFVPAVNQKGLNVALASMGFAVGDVNMDGSPDFFISAWKTGTLLYSMQSQWFDFTDAVGINDQVTLPRIGWGAWFADMDVDGDHDLQVLYGFLDTHWANPVEQLDSLFIQDAQLTMADQAADWGLTSTDSRRGLIVADVNRDGWPDPVYTSVLGDHGVSLSRCGEGAWLRVSLEQPGMNRHGISATVRVVSGDTVWTEWIWAGGVGFAGGGPPEALFGLGTLATVDRVEVIWPDGEVSQFADVATQQAVHIRREE
jgi:enediyne biosynthesis protein E4